MNLQNVLDLNELNRNSYNTYRRRAGLYFMDKSLAPGRDRYDYRHAVSLGCFLELVRDGIDPRQASGALTSCFDFIDAMLYSINRRISPGPCFITVTRYADGVTGFATGAENAADLYVEGLQLTRVSVNVIAVFKVLHSRESEIDQDATDEESEIEQTA